MNTTMTSMNSMNTMTLGSSTFLLVLGAIMRFATIIESSDFDIQMIGSILMIAGAVGAIVSLFVFTASRRSNQLSIPRATIVEKVKTREVL